MNHIEATQYIKATMVAFGPGEAISMTQDTWAKLHEAMNVLIEQPAQRKPLTDLGLLGVYESEQQGRWGDHVRGLRAVEEAANGIKEQP